MNELQDGDINNNEAKINNVQIESIANKQKRNNKTSKIMKYQEHGQAT